MGVKWYNIPAFGARVSHIGQYARSDTESRARLCTMQYSGRGYGKDR